jgi:hypothetical protein
MPKLEEPKVVATIHDASNPITVSMAKEFLGWSTDGDDEYSLRDIDGTKIYCLNNMNNRPLYKSNYEKLKQEILRRRWLFNGEPIIIGESGKVLNGQHSLIALVLSSQEITQNPELWEEYWNEEPYIEKLVVSGVSEDDSIVNTMDTCKPRSLADVIFRSEYFSSTKPGERKKISKTADFAVRTMWQRTGASLDAFSVKRTHAESLNFIERHMKIIDSIKFIHDLECGNEKHVTKLISLGNASALLYLMAAGSSDQSYYSAIDTRSEDNIKFDLWENAEEFWEKLISDDSFEVVRKAIGKLVLDGDSTAASTAAIIIKSWELFVEGTSITPGKLKLKYVTNDHGANILGETPTLGGIDLGIPDELPDGDEETTSSEIETRKAEVKKKTKKSTEDKKPVSKVKKRKAQGGGDLDVGDTCWVIEEDEESNWPGKITEIYGAGDAKIAKVKVSNGYAGAGNEYETAYDKIQRDKP